MLTPIEVRRVRVEQRRVVRLIVDHGGMFISVDGDSDTRRQVVARALAVAMEHAGPGAAQVGPMITPISPIPVCHGNIVGQLGPETLSAVTDFLRSAGFSIA